MSPFKIINNHVPNNMSQQEVPSTYLPLFKIIFRDIPTARKYRKRVENIFDYFTTDSSVHDEHDQMDENAGLELNIFEKKVVPENSFKEPSLGKSKKSRKRKRKKKNSQNLGILKKNKTSNDQSYEIAINNDLTASTVANIASDQTTHEQTNPLKQVNNWIEVDLKAENAEESSQVTNLLERRKENKNLNNFYAETTFFENSSVKLGSYGFFNQDQKIVLSKNGLNFLIPIEKDSKVQVKSMNVELDEIIKVFVNFSLSKPVLIFFLNHNKADEIKNLISTGDSHDLGCDSTLFQKITISPSCISANSKYNIKQLFNPKKLMIEVEPMCLEKILEDSSSKKDEPSIVQTKTSTELEQSFLCNAVRVGSYEYAKKIRNFTISRSNIKFCMPHLKETSTVTITIDMSEIKKISARFLETIPIMFCSITNKAMKMISDSLGMNDREELFNNSSKHQIIIYPQKLSEGHPIFIELTKLGKLEILSKEDLDSILDKLFKPSIKKGIIKSVIPKTSKLLLDDEESISNSCVTKIHLLSNDFSIGDRDYKYSDSNAEVILSEKGYDIYLPMFKSGSVDFMNISFHFENLYGHKLQIYGNHAVIYFRLKRKFVRTNEKCLRPYGVYLNEETNGKTDNSAGRRVMIVLKIEDNKLMLLLELLHKNGSKFITKDCATEGLSESL